MTHDNSILTRAAIALTVLLACPLSFVGCRPSSGQSRYKETTKAFVGAVVQEGKPISLPEGARLSLIHDDTFSKFGIPLKQDGTFTIGWMPTGKYSGELIWTKEPTKVQPNGSQGRFNLPNGLTIEKDRTQYEVELGKGWKP